MKKLLMCVLALSLISCSKNETKEEKKSGGFSDIVSGVKNANSMKNSVQDVTKNIEELKVMTPLSNEELKAAFPETLMGMKRTEISVGDAAMMNLSSATAKYKSDEDKTVTIEVMDGAGEMGSAMVASMIMGMSGEREKTTETGFEKTTQINGMKALVSEDKTENYVNSKIQIIAKKRYYISLSGKQVSYDELEKVFNAIDLNKLK